MVKFSRNATMENNNFGYAVSVVLTRLEEKKTNKFKKYFYLFCIAFAIIFICIVGSFVTLNKSYSQTIG